MKGPFKAVEVCKGIFWVGAIDWTLRDFHGYSTGRGSTYNAYLIVAEHVTLVDTVKAPFLPEMMSRISSVIDPEKIEYIITHHTEMDHSGALPELLKLIHPKKLISSTTAVDAMQRHFHWDTPVTTVKDGESMDLGGLSLTFLDTRMLHWPESMMSYCPERGVLFSQDGFGMHLASSERFDDELPIHLLRFEAAKYYANIVMPFSPIVKRLLERVQGLNLDIRIIAPDHGPIWRGCIGDIVSWYAEWSERRAILKAVVVYDTMWGSSALMARSVAEGLTSEGVSVKVMSLGANHRSDVMTEILDAGALIVGSPTINNNIFPTMVDLLVYMKGLKPAGLIGAAFGSFGWSGESVKQLEGLLKDMKVEIVSDSVNVKYVPDATDLDSCFALGVSVARKLHSLKS
ncbi:MAG: FprA family A-type flavoprotein [Candidatus Brocadiia bacterium]